MFKQSPKLAPCPLTDKRSCLSCAGESSQAGSWWLEATSHWGPSTEWLSRGGKTKKVSAKSRWTRTCSSQDVRHWKVLLVDKEEGHRCRSIKGSTYRQATTPPLISQFLWVNLSQTLLLFCMPGRGGWFVQFAEHPKPPWAVGHKNNNYWGLAAPATWGAQHAGIIREPGMCWLGPLQPEGQTGKQHMGFRATAVHCQASPSAPGEHGPKLTERVCPQTFLWTLNSPVLWDSKEHKRLYRAWSCASHSSGGHLQGTPSYSPPVGTKCSSAVYSLSIRHTE